VNRQHARPGRYLPPETPPRESLRSLVLGVVGILLVAIALLWLLPGAK
jgi:hypothetical protein